jgi:hypothetical protein
MITKVESKGTKLADILAEHFTGKMNLARIKFLSKLIRALCKVQTVSYEKLATAFDSTANVSSSLRRIQRFMAEYALDTDLIARLIFKLLPHKPPYRLIMDRTNWKFGQANINVLTLAVAYQGVAFPLLITMLDKRGNSNTAERIAIMKRYYQLFGSDTMECLLADREFVGEKWIEHLNGQKKNYYVRIRENFYVYNPRNGKRVKASRMFSGLPCNESWHLKQPYRVNEQPCYLSAAKVKSKQGKPELQIIISFCQPENAVERYKE